MFNNDDAENMAKMNGAVPDGVFDASSYAQTVSDIFDMISGLDPDRYDKSIKFMMECINLCYVDNEEEDTSEFSKEKAEDVITALSYYVLQLYANIHEDTREEFIQYQREVAIPDTFEQCKALPFYDIKDDVDNILKVMDEISDGDFSNVKIISPEDAHKYGIDLDEGDSN